MSACPALVPCLTRQGSHAGRQFSQCIETQGECRTWLLVLRQDGRADHGNTGGQHGEPANKSSDRRKADHRGKHGAARHGKTAHGNGSSEGRVRKTANGRRRTDISRRKADAWRRTQVCRDRDCPDQVAEVGVAEFEVERSGLSLPVSLVAGVASVVTPGGRIRPYPFGNFLAVGQEILLALATHQCAASRVPAGTRGTSRSYEPRWCRLRSAFRRCRSSVSCKRAVSPGDSCGCEVSRYLWDQR